MTAFLQNKLVRLAIGFCIGIIIEFYAEYPIKFLAASILLTFSAYIGLFIRGLKKKLFNVSWILEIFSIFIATLLGGIVLNSKTVKPLDDSSFYDVKYCFFTTVQEEQQSEKFTSCLVSITAIRKNNDWVEIDPIECKIFLKKDKQFKTNIGTSYISKGRPKIAEENSKYFDQSKKKQLFYTLFLQNVTTRELSSKNKSLSFKYFCYSILSNLRTKLRRCIEDNNVYGVLLALTLGDKSHLDKDIQKFYSESGTIHVLAVSGLHVGMVYLLLQYLMTIIFLGKSRRKEKIVNVFSIVALWIYAGITGFSPSVLRASLMFSLVSIAKIFSKQNSIFSTLSISAIVLLSFSPFMIFDLGFQLSYLAVIGISTLNTTISKFIKSDKKILSTLCELTSMSLSAQIATLPIILYVFKKFPVYFIPANWIIVPIASVILNLGISVLVLGFVPFIGNLSIFLTEIVVKFSNYYVKFITSLPFHQIGDIKISLFQTSTLSILIFFIFIFYESKNFICCIFSIISFTVLINTLLN